MDRNLEICLSSCIDFLFSFGQCGGNRKIKSNLFLERKVLVTKYMSKIVKFRQSYSCNGRLPYHCSVYYLVCVSVYTNIQ